MLRFKHRFFIGNYTLFILIWAARHRYPTIRPCAVGLSALTRCPPTMRRKAQICFRFAKICFHIKHTRPPTLTLVNVLPSLPRSFGASCVYRRRQHALSFGASHSAPPPSALRHSSSGCDLHCVAVLPEVTDTQPLRGCSGQTDAQLPIGVRTWCRRNHDIGGDIKTEQSMGLIVSSYIIPNERESPV